VDALVVDRRGEVGVTDDGDQYRSPELWGIGAAGRSEHLLGPEPRDHVVDERLDVLVGEVLVT